MRKCIGTALVLLLAVPAALGAGEDEAGAFFRTAADDTHHFISSEVESFARYFDSFLGGDRALDESTGSYLRFRTWWYGEEGSLPELDSALMLRLVLPRTQERLRLEIGSEEESATRDEASRPTDPLNPDAEKATGFLAGLRAVLLDTDQWRAQVAGGVRMDFPMDPYLRGVLSRDHRFGPWRLRLEEGALWRVSDGYGFRTTARLGRPAGEGLLFRSDSNAVYTEEELGWRVEQALCLVQVVDEDGTISWRAAGSWKSRPVFRSATWSIDATLRRRLYSSWLFLDLRPGMIWPRDRDFRPTPAFLFRLEALFGEEMLKKED